MPEEVIINSELEKFKELTCKYFDSMADPELIYRVLSKKDYDEILTYKVDELKNNLVEYCRKHNYATIDFVVYKDLLISYVQNNFNIKKLQALRYNISNLIDEAKETAFPIEYNDFFEKVIQAFRYIMLGIDQIKQDKIDNKLIIMESNLNNIDKNIEVTDGSLKNNLIQAYTILHNMESSIRDILPQAVTVIGIFVTILIVFFGDIKLIESFQVLEKKSIEAFLFIFLLSANILFDFTMLLMFLISRISQTSINVRCSKFYDINKHYREMGTEENQPSKDDKHTEENQPSKNNQYTEQLKMINLELRKLKNDRLVCGNCAYNNLQLSLKNNYLDSITIELLNTNKKKFYARQCGFVNKVANKYPYIFFINFIFIMLEVLVCLVWIAHYFVFVGYKVEIISRPITSLCILLIIIDIFACLMPLAYSLGKSRYSTANKSRKFIFIVSATLMVIFITVLLSFGVSIK